MSIPPGRPRRRRYFLPFLPFFLAALPFFLLVLRLLGGLGLRLRLGVLLLRGRLLRLGGLRVLRRLRGLGLGGWSRDRLGLRGGCARRARPCARWRGTRACAPRGSRAAARRRATRRAECVCAARGRAGGSSSAGEVGSGFGSGSGALGLVRPRPALPRARAARPPHPVERSAPRGLLSGCRSS